MTIVSMLCKTFLKKCLMSFLSMMSHAFTRPEILRQLPRIDCLSEFECCILMFRYLLPLRYRMRVFGATEIIIDIFMISFFCGLFRSLSPWIAINDSVLHKFIVQRGLCKCAPFWRFGHSSSHKTIGIILLTLVRSHLFFLSRITK